MSALALSYLAGLLTTLSPCVLPLLPLVLAGTLKGGRLGPVAFALGMIVAFVAVGLLVAGIGIGLGLSVQLLRQISAVVLILMGLFLMSELSRRDSLWLPDRLRHTPIGWRTAWISAG